MKYFIPLVILLTQNNAFAVNQHMACSSPDTEASLCWSTTGIYLHSHGTKEELQAVPLELPEGQAVYTNASRSAIVQDLFYSTRYIVVDAQGRKAKLTCGKAESGDCP